MSDATQTPFSTTFVVVGTAWQRFAVVVFVHEHDGTFVHVAPPNVTSPVVVPTVGVPMVTANALDLPAIDGDEVEKPEVIVGVVKT